LKPLRVQCRKAANAAAAATAETIKRNATKIKQTLKYRALSEAIAAATAIETT